MADNSDIGPIQWDDNMPSSKGQFIPVLSPKSVQPVHGIITSERWHGVYTHFQNERTGPCTGTELDCEGCFRKRPRRWKAYLAGVTFGTGRKCVIELTQGAMESCPELIRRDVNLRGRKIVLWRANPSKQAPVRVRLEGQQPDHLVPRPFDLQRALCVIWGLRPDDDGGMMIVGDNPPMH